MNGRVALVTGAGSGIGRAVALALAARGMSVWAAGRTPDALEASASAAQGSAGSIRPYALDVTDDEGLAGLRDSLAAEEGRLDTLVHSAGTIAFGALEEAQVADLDAQYRANLRAPYLLTQTVLPLLREAGGDVVFINSTAGLGSRPEAGQFSATQAALRSLADGLRGEVNEQGVRVLSVFPGRTATPRQERIHAREGREYRPELLMQPEDVAALVLSALELPRTAEVMEIAMRPFAKPGSR